MGGTNTNAMRSMGHDNTMKHSSESSGPMSHLAGLVGGKRRSKKGKKSKARRSKSARSKRVKRGGMGVGFGAALNEAIVPFGIFAMQKKSQRRRNNKEPFRRNRRNRTNKRRR